MCGTVHALGTQSQREGALVRSPNRSPLVEPADEWVQHQWRGRVQEEEEIHDNM